MGVTFAILAMVSWGIGDFLIQKSARKVGRIITMFLITASASLVLFPFIIHELPALWHNKNLLLLYSFTSFIRLGVALLVLQAMKIGKLSVIEPLNTVEVPVAILLAITFAHEQLSLSQTACIVLLVGGILLLSTRSFTHLRTMAVEKGVTLALLGNMIMGLTDYLFLYSSREGSPLLINWYTSVVIFVFTGIYIVFSNRGKRFPKIWKKQKWSLLVVSLFDNTAWITYSYSALFLPMALTTGISESYIGIGTLLGVTLNKERLHIHQWIGMSLTLSAALLLITTV